MTDSTSPPNLTDVNTPTPTESRSALYAWVKSAATIQNLIDKGDVLDLAPDFTTQIGAAVKNVLSGLEVFAGRNGSLETYQTAAVLDPAVPGDLLARLEALQGDLANAENRISELEDDNSALRDENSNLTGEVEEAEKSIASLEARLEPCTGGCEVAPRNDSAPLDGYGNVPPKGSTLAQQVEFYKGRVRHYRERKEHYKRYSAKGDADVEQQVETEEVRDESDGRNTPPEGSDLHQQIDFYKGRMEHYRTRKEYYKGLYEEGDPECCSGDCAGCEDADSEVENERERVEHYRARKEHYKKLYLDLKSEADAQTEEKKDTFVANDFVDRVVEVRNFLHKTSDRMVGMGGSMEVFAQASGAAAADLDEALEELLVAVESKTDDEIEPTL